MALIRFCFNYFYVLRLINRRQRASVTRITSPWLNENVLEISSRTRKLNNENFQLKTDRAHYQYTRHGHKTKIEHNHVTFNRVSADAFLFYIALYFYIAIVNSADFREHLTNLCFLGLAAVANCRRAPWMRNLIYYINRVFNSMIVTSWSHETCALTQFRRLTMWEMFRKFDRKILKLCYEY